MSCRFHEDIIVNFKWPVKIEMFVSSVLPDLAAKPQEGDIPVPHFRRKETESEKAFLRRVGRETNHVRFLTKNQVERQPEVELEKQEHEAGKRKSEKKKE